MVKLTAWEVVRAVNWSVVSTTKSLVCMAAICLVDSEANCAVLRLPSWSVAIVSTDVVVNPLSCKVLRFPS